MTSSAGRAGARGRRPRRGTSGGRCPSTTGLPAGVDDGPARGLVPLVDLQAPRQVGRAAVQLVVEPVAEAADGLRERDAGGGRVGEVEEADPGPAAADPGAERAERDGAPDAEAALPDLQRVERVAALAQVGLGRGDDVVDPAADDAERHGPGRDVEDLTRLVPRAATSRRPVSQTATTMPSEDAQGVHPDRQRAEVEDPDGGAGDVTRSLGGGLDGLRSGASGDAMVVELDVRAVDLHRRGAAHAVGEALLLDRVDVVDVLVRRRSTCCQVVRAAPVMPGLLGEALELRRRCSPSPSLAGWFGKTVLWNAWNFPASGGAERGVGRRGSSCRCAGCRRGSS